MHRLTVSILDRDGNEGIVRLWSNQTTIADGTINAIYDILSSIVDGVIVAMSYSYTVTVNSDPPTSGSLVWQGCAILTYDNDTNIELYTVPARKDSAFSLDPLTYNQVVDLSIKSAISDMFTAIGAVTPLNVDINPSLGLEIYGVT